MDGNLTVTGGEEASSQNVALQIQNGAEVTVASGNTAAYNANVLSGSTLVTKNLSVDHNLHVDGGNTLVDVDKLTAGHVYVSNAATLDVQQSIAVDRGIEIGNASHVGTSQLISHGTLSTTDLRLRSDAVLSSYSDVTVNGDVHLHAGAVWEMHGGSNSVTGTMYLEDAKAGSSVILRGDGAVLTMPGVLDFARSSWTGNEALISLEGIDGKGGVTLDFSYGVHLRNIGFELTEGQCLTLASTNGGTTGWYFSDGGSVTVWDAAGKSYHAELGTSDDAAQNITLTIRHEVKEPLKIGDGSLVYIEMYSNATAPAVPHLAYTSAKYNTTSGSWTSTTGNAYNPSNLLKFSNVQMSEGALLYMGELDKGDSTTDYRADHHFGGNIVISTTASTTDALVLNGQVLVDNCTGLPQSEIIKQLGDVGDLLGITSNSLVLVVQFYVQVTGDDLVGARFNRIGKPCEGGAHQHREAQNQCNHAGEKGALCSFHFLFLLKNFLGFCVLFFLPVAGKIGIM